MRDGIIAKPLFTIIKAISSKQSNNWKWLALWIPQILHIRTVLRKSIGKSKAERQEEAIQTLPTPPHIEDQDTLEAILTRAMQEPKKIAAVELVKQ